jgi:hypothetical protein
MADSPTGIHKGARGAGWVPFAGTLFLILGAFNLIDGVAAVSEDGHFLGDELFVGNLVMWGTIMVTIGALQLATGWLLFRGSGLGVVLGIFMAGINIVAHLLFLPAYPIWSIIIMTLDVLVIYGLTIYGDSFR